jgi:esterase/lipase superfamily enzyme
MLFLTNRVLVQGTRSQANRRIDFQIEDNSALQSLFFCRRNGPGDYIEILSDTFFQELRRSPAQQILLFIHGFHNLPENAAFQHAERLQALFDLMQPNLVYVVPLIWPCQKPDDYERYVVQDYFTDQMAADASGWAFARALAKFREWQLQDSDDVCTKRLNVVAHSMGNRVFRESMRIWSEDILRREPPLLFRNSAMVAPDVVNQTLERNQKGTLLTMSARNVVVYHAADDLALRASKVANLGEVSRRLGHTGPLDIDQVAKNVFAVDCDNFNTKYDLPIGHTYFLEDPRSRKPGVVFLHLFHCISTGRVPNPEQRKQVL